MTAEWIELFKTLGVSAPLVIILLYLLKQSTDERKEITSKFLQALSTLVKESNEGRLRTADEMATMTATFREERRQAHEEHTGIVDAIDKLDLRRDLRRQGDLR